MTHRGDRFDGDGTQPVTSCGTEDVLTCHVIVLRHPLTQVVGLAHVDEYVRETGLERFLAAFLDRVRERYFADDGDDDDGDEYEWEELEEEETDETESNSEIGNNFAKLFACELRRT